MNLKKTVVWIGYGGAAVLALVILLVLLGLGGRAVAQWRNAQARAITSPRGIDELR